MAHPLVGQPEVSVVIPTRSRWHLLSRAALPSALGQVGVEHEVIVVDDGSIDETPARLAALEDPRVRVIRHERSEGLSRARNSGIEAAQGTWIAFLDDDDLWAPTKLRAQLDAVGRHAASFVYGASVVLDEKLRVIGLHEPTDPADLRRRLRTNYSIPAGCSNVMVETELIRRLGGFDDRLWHLQDWDMWLRLAAASKAAACEDILVGYVLHPENSFLGDSTHDMVNDLRYLLDKHGAGADGLEVDAASFERWVAYRVRRAGQRRRAARLYLRSARTHRSPRDVLLAGYSLVDGRIAETARGLVRADPSSAADRNGGPLDEPDWLARYR